MSEILRVEHLMKVYGNGVMANKDINFSAKKGEIHAICGENGAGKSTLMKMLYGIEQPSEGSIYVKGEKVNLTSSAKAIEHSIGMVHQHFMLVPSLTVAENVVLGVEPKRGIRFDAKKAIQMTEEIAQKYNLPVPAQEKVENISVGLKQRVEIIKALLKGAEILILDEPTTVLTPQETEELFVELKHLRDQGHTILFISHKLYEVKKLCDRVTVMRAGRMIATRNIADVTEADISRMMELIPRSNIHVGIIVAIVLVILTYYFMYYTRWGYEIRLVGQNGKFAKYTGVSIGAVTVFSQMLGSALAGGAGAMETLGLYSRFSYTDLTGHGWDGVTLAILAGRNPKYIPLAALFLAYLRKGADLMSMRAGMQTDFVSVIQAVILVFLLAEQFLSGYRQRKTYALSKQLETAREEMGG